MPEYTAHPQTPAARRVVKKIFRAMFWGAREKWNDMVPDERREFLLLHTDLLLCEIARTARLTWSGLSDIDRNILLLQLLTCPRFCACGRSR